MWLVWVTGGWAWPDSHAFMLLLFDYFWIFGRSQALKRWREWRSLCISLKLENQTHISPHTHRNNRSWPPKQSKVSMISIWTCRIYSLIKFLLLFYEDTNKQLLHTESPPSPLADASSAPLSFKSFFNKLHLHQSDLNRNILRAE